ncbi:Uncharacterised protein [Acinetobacter baumannii]|nr:Uncharacterised protein [Acinetobacter baumannii]
MAPEKTDRVGREPLGTCHGNDCIVEIEPGQQFLQPLLGLFPV